MAITFCTFLFDIGRKDWSSFGLHENTYLHWFNNLLSLDINLYIKTEERFVESIKKTRQTIDPEFKKTIIVTTTLKNLVAYKLYFTPLTDLMSSKRFVKNLFHPDVPEMTKPLYNVLMFDKVNILEEVAEKNPFNTEYFSWVDAGFIRDNSLVEHVKRWPDPQKLNLQPNKIKFFCINPDIHANTKNEQRHLLSQMRLLKGTIFFAHNKVIPKLKTIFDYYVTDSLTKGYIGSDEKIFDLCCKYNPTLFDLFQCNWREEFKLFSYEYKEPEQTKYTVNLEWEEKDIEKANDWDFWFCCVEGEDGHSIFREDFDASEIDYMTFKKLNKKVSFMSKTAPATYVIWPHSKTKGYLVPLKKPVKLQHPDNTLKKEQGITVDKYYFVNLDRRTDRLSYIQKQIQKSKLLSQNIQRFFAVDGREVDPRHYLESFITERACKDIVSGVPVIRGLSVTPGAFGFYLTHTKIFENSVKTNKTFFVMGDDIVISKTFDEEFKQILIQLPKDFDFCYLGYYDTKYEKIPFSDKLFIPKGQFCGPHGYIISPKGAAKLLDLIFPIDIQLDSRLYQLQDKVDYYAAYNRLCMYEDKFGTDIQHETGCVKTY